MSSTSTAASTSSRSGIVATGKALKDNKARPGSILGTKKPGGNQVQVQKTQVQKTNAPPKSNGKPGDKSKGTSGKKKTRALLLEDADEDGNGDLCSMKSLRYRS